MSQNLTSADFSRVVAECDKKLRAAEEELRRREREEAMRRIWDAQAAKCRDFANIASGFTR